MALLVRSRFARVAVHFDLLVLFLLGVVETVWPATIPLLVIGVALVLITPLLAAYVHRTSKRGRADARRRRTARRPALLLAYLLLGATFVLAALVASGYWVESGPLAIAAFVVVLTLPILAAYLRDSASASS